LGEPLQTSDWQPFIRHVKGGYATDFVGYTQQRLVENGVLVNNIDCAEVDVASDPDYFSLTAQEKTGRPKGRNGFMVSITQ
jgi:hypothetical protein